MSISVSRWIGTGGVFSCSSSVASISAGARRSRREWAQPEPCQIGRGSATSTRAKDAGRHTICQVQTIDDARIAVDAGADVLAVQGNEAGGHTGRQNLLPFLVEVLEQMPNTPVIAAGGITNGRSLAAVLAAGADGAWMGSAFVATLESTEIPDPIKQAVLETGYGDTIYSKVFDIINQAALDDVPGPDHIAIRAKRNAFTNRWHGSEHDLLDQLTQIAPALHRGRPHDVNTEICDDAARRLTQRAQQLQT